MKEWKIEWINETVPYINTLIKANNDFIKLRGIDCIDDVYELEQIFLELTLSLSTLIPSRKSDGLYLISYGFSEIEETINLINEQFATELYNIKQIRNKLEHEPHSIRVLSSSSGTTSSSITASFKKKCITQKQFDDVISNIEKCIVEHGNHCIVKKDENEKYLHVKFVRDTVDTYMIKEHPNLLGQQDIMYEIYFERYEDHNSELRPMIRYEYFVSSHSVSSILCQLTELFFNILSQIDLYRDDMNIEKDNPFFKKYLQVDFKNINDFISSDQLYNTSSLLRNLNKF